MLAFVRLCAHYYSQAPGSRRAPLIRDAGRLAGIPGVLIHGRLDLSCPAATAWELARAWPGAELLIEDHSGHWGSDTKRGCLLERARQVRQPVSGPASGQASGVVIGRGTG